MSPTSRLPVAILGATGMVGQRLALMLDRHPWFQLAAVAASARSAGRRYGDTRWIFADDCPAEAAGMEVLPCDPDAMPAGVRVVLSALDSSVAREVEGRFRDAGYAVVTNASPHRQDADVPLIIPEVNPDHLSLLDGRPGPGLIVANPNCCAVPVAMALAPLHQAWGVEAVTIATWQAVSGAGYPGEPSYDILGTVHPHAGDEEDKLMVEPQKILGLPGQPAPFPSSARCVRVPTADGHLIGLNVRLKGDPSPEAALEALREWRGACPPLPSCPPAPLRISARRDRPSPRHDADADGGMGVTIGRVERCPVMGVKLFALAHNVVRGAAGAALANAELLLAKGYVQP